MNVMDQRILRSLLTGKPAIYKLRGIWRVVHLVDRPTGETWAASRWCVHRNGVAA